MSAASAVRDERNLRLTRDLICLMFFTFAMTSDAVGGVIPHVIAEFGLSMTAAGAFHYVPMIAIACGAFCLGFLADRLGRRATIMLGLSLYGLASLLFAIGRSFGFFVMLLGLSGLGISIFKVGGLALVGDISDSRDGHTRLMNRAEGFFALGSIVGPGVVALLMTAGLSWKWLYVSAAALCCVLIGIAARVRPRTAARPVPGAGLRETVELLQDPHLLFTSGLISLYVAVEVAVYVWMPTYLAGYHGPHSWLTTYGLALFFALRAGGRFLAVWLLARWPWTGALAVFGLGIFGCFAGTVGGGLAIGIWLLPLSGLFMSMIYPTLNSRGISAYGADRQGAAAGVILAFTALSAALGPLAMAAVSDRYGDPRSGFLLASGFALLLALGLGANWWRQPARIAASGESPLSAR